ncbi:MAG: TetR/AcrR family transcriptional regulator [Gemmatimonadota bacterium]|jgi:AcrR family transcriptional regulator
MNAKSKRPYRKKKRAESEEETRRRITEAAVELHGTVGPANTTVTELAEKAGVSRMTVYNHFPTDADLLAACSSHWAGEHPYPDPEGWAVVTDPTERLELALVELYRWFDRGRDMLANTLRDAPLVPALGELMDDWWGGYMDRVVSVLSEGWPDDPVLRVALRVVVDFNTWRLLSASGLENDAAARLTTEMVAGREAERAWD